MKNILVVGADGFCGWPLSIHLSSKGHKVFLVDNLSRRLIDVEIGANSLHPIADFWDRIETWNTVASPKYKMRGFNVDASKEFERLKLILKQNEIDVIINLAEQRSAPYSMKNSQTARYTVKNNLNCNNNLLQAIVEVNQDIHYIHLGTMGVYGYGPIQDVTIPEGYIDVTYQGQNINILHPAYPGSIYHLTKTQDALFLQFYAKNWGLKITDLHQGIIWGFKTPETQLHKDLANRFDYDSDYGTVLNRFIIQSAIGYPLTVYGTGGQTRAFININDSMKCIQLALENPPKRGDRVEIFNQMTETHRLTDLTKMIQKANPDTEISFIDNPRNELAENDLKVENKKFLNLGLKPILLDEENISELIELCRDYKSRINMEIVKPISFWKK
jgi:UDP-sulfoquinovose synthase